MPMATAPKAQYLYSRILRRTTGTQATVKRERPVAVISRLMNVMILAPVLCVLLNAQVRHRSG